MKWSRAIAMRTSAKRAVRSRESPRSEIILFALITTAAVCAAQSGLSLSARAVDLGPTEPNGPNHQGRWPTNDNVAHGSLHLKYKSAHTGLDAAL